MLSGCRVRVRVALRGYILIGTKGKRVGRKFGNIGICFIVFGLHSRLSPKMLSRKVLGYSSNGHVGVRIGGNHVLFVFSLAMGSTMRILTVVCTVLPPRTSMWKACSSTSLGVLRVLPTRLCPSFLTRSAMAVISIFAAKDHSRVIPKAILLLLFVVFINL